MLLSWLGISNICIEKNINIIAEAHQDLNRKLDEAIKINNETEMMKKIIHLREKYDLHMRVERYVSDESGITEKDRTFIRTIKNYYYFHKNPFLLRIYIRTGIDNG